MPVTGTCSGSSKAADVHWRAPEEMELQHTDTLSKGMLSHYVKLAKQFDTILQIVI